MANSAYMPEASLVWGWCGGQGQQAPAPRLDLEPGRRVALSPSFSAKNEEEDRNVLDEVGMEIFLDHLVGPQIGLFLKFFEEYAELAVPVPGSVDPLTSPQVDPRQQYDVKRSWNLNFTDASEAEGGRPRPRWAARSGPGL